MKTILYIHGMGGGEDSRIPAFLNDKFRTQHPDIRVVVRTYDFHPDRAAAQIDAWFEELQPALVIGESLGANHALALYGRKYPGCGAAAPQSVPPLLLVSPALNAPKFLYAMRGPARIPLVHNWLSRCFKPREGRRQAIDFAPETLTAWGAYRIAGRSHGPIYAFFGRRDHYRRWGVVSVKKWRRTFGPGTYAIYDGTHYMEEAYLRKLLIPAILQRI